MPNRFFCGFFAGLAGCFRLLREGFDFKVVFEKLTFNCDDLGFNVLCRAPEDSTFLLVCLSEVITLIYCAFKVLSLGSDFDSLNFDSGC